jgi:hypothetical protein
MFLWRRELHDAGGENVPNKYLAFTTALAAALSVSGCATTSNQVASQRVSGTRCEALTNLDQRVQQLLSANNIVRLEPAYRMTPHFDGPKPAYVEGVAIYIPADAGVTEAYVERALSCHAASSGRALPSDPFRVDGVRSITANEVRQTIRVDILGVDREAGERIWHTAQGLSARVEVRQLSSAPSQSDAM